MKMNNSKKKYLILLFSILLLLNGCSDDDDVNTTDCILLEMLESEYYAPSIFSEGKLTSYRGIDIEYDVNGKMTQIGNPFLVEFKYNALGQIIAFGSNSVNYSADTIITLDTTSSFAKPKKIILTNGKITEAIIDGSSPGYEDVWRYVYEYSDDFQNLESFKLYNREWSSGTLGYLHTTYSTSSSLNPAYPAFSPYYLNFLLGFYILYPLENIHLHNKNNISSLSSTDGDFEIIYNRTCEGPDDAVNECYPDEIPGVQYGGETVEYFYDCSGERHEETKSF